MKLSNLFVHIWKFSEKQSAEVKLNDPEVNQKLNPNRPTNFIIHGFMSGLDAGTIHRQLLVFSISKRSD